MAKTLEEYAAQHPQQEPERERQAIEETARSYREQMQERETVEGLKASILQQLEQGNAPETILYTALRAIGILTHDEQWTEAGRQTLDTVYADLAQQSLLTDNAAIAAQRLDTMQAEYNDKLRRQLQRNLNGYRRIEKALTEALQAVNALDPEPDTLTK